MITAPFNFVPQNHIVYYPTEWSDKISQDIPFSDALSGVIRLKITAGTPIFVRNGHSKKDEENKTENYKSFSRTPNGEYFIPATSIKGAIRSVLEIMSFGKVHLDEDMMFAQREWDNPALYPIKGNQAELHCGWLKRSKDVMGGYVYEITDCGKPRRIAQTRIDEYIGKQILRCHFCQSSKEPVDLQHDIKLGDKDFDPKTAVYKYKLLEGCKSLENLYFARDEEFAAEYQENRVKVSNTGDKGTIVMTGQPDLWKWPRPTRLDQNAGKFYEFVFLAPTNNARKYSISAEDFNHYTFVYADSPDWAFHKQDIDTKGIPVFFRVNAGQVKDWGLAYLYKLPYDKTPYQLLPEEHKKADPDLAECIFGYVNRKTKECLKGRVQFSHAKTKDTPSKENEIKLVLGSPKASYYPIYIEQSGGEYKTYNDGNLSGRKRYVVRAEEFVESSEKEEVNSILTPLSKGTVFTDYIYFHNLRRVELGALLSAITFHNNSDVCFHQLGQGKPYGFGKVHIEIENYPADLPKPVELMAEFERCMIAFLKNNKEQQTQWVKREEIKNLCYLARTEIQPREVFDYMKLDVDNRINDFEAAKVNKEYLHRFEELKDIRSNELQSLLAVSQPLANANNYFADKDMSFTSAGAFASSCRKLRKEDESVFVQHQADLEDIVNSQKGMISTWSDLDKNRSRIDKELGKELTNKLFA